MQQLRNTTVNAYWQRLLYEVQHKNDRDCFFAILPKEESISKPKQPAMRDFRSLSGVRIAAGAPYEDVHFTFQEARVIAFALEVKTVRDVANNMGLSPRTVEFHLKQARNKLGVKSKRALLNKIHDTKFVNNFNQFMQAHEDEICNA